MSDYVNIASIFISIVSAGFAGWSVREAKRSKRIAQIDLLYQHFANVEYLFEIIEKPISHHYGEAADKIPLALGSLNALKTILYHDEGFALTLERINEIKKIAPHTSSAIHNGPPWTPPQDFEQIKNTFSAKKREYLNIG